MFVNIQICPELKENLVAHVQSFTPHQVGSMIFFVFRDELVLDYAYVTIYKQSGNDRYYCTKISSNLCYENLAVRRSRKSLENLSLFNRF